MLDHSRGGPAVRPVVAPPPPQRSRVGLIASLVAGVVVLMCLGYGSVAFFAVRHLGEPEDTTARPVARPTTAAPTGTPAAPPATLAVHQGDVKHLMIGPPAGARKWPHARTTETLTVTTAAADLAGLRLGPPGVLGEDDLTGDGFQDGYVRRWIDKHGTYVTGRIYRFDHAGGGLEFADNKVGGADGEGWGDGHRNLKDAPNAATFVRSKTRNGRQEALAVGGFSDIAILVTTEQHPPATVTTAASVFEGERKKL